MSNTLESNDEIKIAIIEDSEIHAEWLNIELYETPGFEVVSIDRKGKEGVRSARELKPKLILLDFQLEDISGIEVAKQLKIYVPNTKIFALTAHTDINIISRIINDKNIDAIAIKGSPFFANNLAAAITCVIEGGTYIDPSLLKKLRESDANNGINGLTKREFEVYIQKIFGKSDEKIAEDLSIELAHVRNIKSRVMKKVKECNKS